MTQLSERAQQDLVATRQRFTREAALHLWDHYDRQWPVSKERAEYARKVVDGEIRAPVPPQIEQGREIFEQRLAESVTVPLHTLNLITAKWPILTRGTSTVGITAQTVTSRIEGLANAQFTSTCPWAEAMGYLLNESHVAAAVIPTSKYWAKVPEYRSADGEIYSHYKRDETGRAPYDDGYDESRMDRDATRKAYEHQRDQYYAANVCSVVEIYGRDEAVPINLRYQGTSLVLDGLITRRRFTKQELIRDHGFVWANMGGPQLSPAEDENAEATLISVWRCDDEGPYVAYSVNGEDTWRVNRADVERKYVDAIMDLAECGLTELPVTWQIGWHLPRRDLDKSGIPFPWAFGPNWATANAIISAIAYRHWQFAYLAPFIELSENDAVLSRLKGDLLREFKLEPMTVKTVPGKLQWPVAPGVGPDAQLVLQQVLGSNAREQTPVAAIGGPGAESGFDRALSTRQALDALGQVMDAGLELARFVGRTQNAIYDGMTIMRGEPLPVRANPKQPPGGESTATKPVYTVPHDMFGGVYDMTAEYPRIPGENIAQVQQWLEVFLKGGMDYFEFRQLAFGDQSPDVSLARKLVWDYLNSPEGHAEMQMALAEYTKDERMKAILSMQQQGQANRSGLPTALGDGTGQPPQGAEQAMGAQSIGSPGQAQLAGIAGGPMAGARQPIPQSPAGAAMAGP